MPVAIRAITRLQDADDINVSLGAGVDEYALCWDNDTAKFVLRAPAAPFAGILATGATVGATSQAQAFTVGVTVGSVAIAETLLQVAETSTASPRGIMSSQHSAGVDGARFHMRKSRGTNASPAIITTGDVLGRLVASGYDGANYLEMGGIDIVSAGTIASTRVPTEIRFLTATDAAPSVLTQRMVIDKAGNVGIGMVAEGQKLHVNGNIQFASGSFIGYRISSDTTIPVFRNVNSGLSRMYTAYSGTKLLAVCDPSIGTDIAIFDGANMRFGIGTTSPATALHVVGAATITGGIRPAADSTTALQLQNAAGTSVLNVDTTNARVGIGTSSLSRKFEVETSLATPSCQMSLFAPSISDGSNVSFGIGKSLSSQNSAFLIWYANGASSYAAFETYGGASPFKIVATQAWLPSLVGIGTTSPATRLDIDAGALTMAEMTAPTGAANKAMLYTKDNGSGKTALCVKLGDDVEIVLATQA